jgi:hypothetical protein
MLAGVEPGAITAVEQVPDEEGIAVEDPVVLDGRTPSVELWLSEDSIVGAAVDPCWVHSPKSGWQPVPQKVVSVPQKKYSEQPSLELVLTWKIIWGFWDNVSRALELQELNAYMVRTHFLHKSHRYHMYHHLISRYNTQNQADSQYLERISILYHQEVGTRENEPSAQYRDI